MLTDELEAGKGSAICLCGRQLSSVTRLRQHEIHCQMFLAFQESHNAMQGTSCTDCETQATTESTPTETRRATLLQMANARLSQGASRDTIEAMKLSYKQAFQSAHAQVKAELRSRLGPRAADVEGMVEAIHKTAADLGGRDSEFDLLRASKAYVKPVRRHLGTCPDTGEEFFAYDTPLDQTVQAMLEGVWEDFKSAQEKMQCAASTATKRFSENRHITDVWDGAEFQGFMARVNLKPEEEPLVFMLYYDGLEVVSGLGQARGTHEFGCFYWALLNLGAEKRMDRNNIRLATICYKRAIGICGMEQVVAGLNKPNESPSWVEWMKRLDSGITLTTPEGPKVFRGGTCMISADTPAASELMGTKKAVGPSTKSICRNCHCRQENGAHKQPCSFLASQPGWKRQCPQRSTSFKLRSSQDLLDYLARLKDVLSGEATHTELQAWMQDQGVNTFLSAVHQMPHFSTLTGCPQDMMHIWCEGVARQGLGAICYWLKTVCKANLYELPKLILAEAKKRAVPRHELPYLNTTRITNLGTGMDGGLPSSDCSFPGTASQVGHFMLYLPSILGPLVPQEHRNHQVWQMALLMTKIGRLLWQRSFTTQDILELDKSIWLHDKVLLGSPFLQHLWKPKNHYLSHIPLDILCWGPPRYYWCMAFEHENQLTKRGAQGNFANVLWSGADNKSLHVALQDCLHGSEESA